MIIKSINGQETLSNSQEKNIWQVHIIQNWMVKWFNKLWTFIVNGSRYPHFSWKYEIKKHNRNRPRKNKKTHSEDDQKETYEEEELYRVKKQIMSKKEKKENKELEKNNSLLMKEKDEYVIEV